MQTQHHMYNQALKKCVKWLAFGPKEYQIREWSKDGLTILIHLKVYQITIDSFLPCYK